jgi:hypothetical protein
MKTRFFLISVALIVMSGLILGFSPIPVNAGNNPDQSQEKGKSLNRDNQSARWKHNNQFSYRQGGNSEASVCWTGTNCPGKNGNVYWKGQNSRNCQTGRVRECNKEGFFAGSMQPEQCREERKRDCSRNQQNQSGSENTRDCWNMYGSSQPQNNQNCRGYNYNNNYDYYQSYNPQNCYGGYNWYDWNQYYGQSYNQQRNCQNQNQYGNQGQSYNGQRNCGNQGASGNRQCNRQGNSGQRNCGGQNKRNCNGGQRSCGRGHG